MKKLTLIAAASLLSLCMQTTAAHAGTYDFADRYIGGGDSPLFRDYIGADYNNFRTSTVATNGSQITVTVRSDFFLPQNRVNNSAGIGLGDFLFTSNLNPAGSAATGFDTDDIFTTGTNWNFAGELNFSDPSATSGVLSLFQINDKNRLRTSDQAYAGAANNEFRHNQYVDFDSSGLVANGFGTWLFNGASLVISFDLLSMGDFGKQLDELGIRYQTTCANDIVQFSVPVNEIPEPSTVLLITMGLAGAIRSRRRSA